MFEEFFENQAFQNNILKICNITNDQLFLLCSSLDKFEKSKNLLLIDNNIDAKIICEQIKIINPSLDVFYLPKRDGNFSNKIDDSILQQANRIYALLKLLKKNDNDKFILIANINSLYEFYPPIERLKKSFLSLKVNQIIKRNALFSWLEKNGYIRDFECRNIGEYSVKGSIIDIYPPLNKNPIRLDFFDDQIESIRSYDFNTQKSISSKTKTTFLSLNEIEINKETKENFRVSYISLFGDKSDKFIIEQLKNDVKFPGHTHYQYFFYKKILSLFEYCDFENVIYHNSLYEGEYFNDYLQHIFKHNLENDIEEKFKNKFYFSNKFIKKNIAKKNNIILYEFDEKDAIDAQIRQGVNFNRNVQLDGNIYNNINKYLRANEKIKIFCYNSLHRLNMFKEFLEEYDYLYKDINNVNEVNKEDITANVIYNLKIPILKSIITSDYIFISDNDIWGEISTRKKFKSKSKSKEFFKDDFFKTDELVVHVEHGIGRYKNITTLDIGIKHDFILIEYADNDRLFVPVENIDLVSRFGNENGRVDKLGLGSWSARKAKIKEKLFKIASELLEIAAKRKRAKTKIYTVTTEEIDKFCLDFLYEETEDQLKSIEDVFTDLANGFPMDRLICGDVGFGKTEVALRASYVVAKEGDQVVVLCPTTILCNQHYKLFKERFSRFPIKVRQLSRLVKPSERKEIIKEIKNGSVDIVIGTHALLSEAVDFSNLSLVIIDEEQRFGVKQKEKLKALRVNTHLLTLSATPIPRTLNMSLSGIRDLSLITTPPTDRQVVKTTIMVQDFNNICDFLLREYHRGGQSYYLVPRISDIDYIHRNLVEKLPDIKIEIAHGQMTPTKLEGIMIDFYEGRTDILLTTTIIEAGIDIPNANCLIVHRADKFGLSQLYQLRGRIGRSKNQAYAYLTIPKDQKITELASKRLRILQSIDELGAGFKISSEDMEIRGVGNLIGEEQSGHIKEIGIELYYNMLEDVMKEIQGDIVDEKWSPEIKIQIPILIPESYIPEVDQRISLYRRLANLSEIESIDSFKDELIDRFGNFPKEFENLLEIMRIKLICKKIAIEKMDVGPNGISVKLKNEEIQNIDSIISFISASENMNFKPDGTFTIKKDTSNQILEIKKTLIELGKIIKTKNHNNNE